jgi:hypothetical protein
LYLYVNVFLSVLKEREFSESNSWLPNIEHLCINNNIPWPTLLLWVCVVHMYVHALMFCPSRKLTENVMCEHAGLKLIVHVLQMWNCKKWYKHIHVCLLYWNTHYSLINWNVCNVILVIGVNDYGYGSQWKCEFFHIHINRLLHHHCLVSVNNKKAED